MMGSGMMMNGMGGGMMLAMGAVCVLAVMVLVLAAAALIKYLRSPQVGSDGA
ncbi:hypothetical protein [uncultured Limimaricola sp.]|uniref:hypothetical protein n=1 Tax=uncultured Limimaricola sp. TaxID=2211667 RepID=UPI0030F5B2E0